RCIVRAGAFAAGYRDRNLRSPHLIADREFSYPLARRRENRVGQRRHHTRSSRLADPARRLEALHQRDVDPWCLVDAQYAVVAEVGLLDATVLESDLAVKRGRQAEDDT